jgi:hypothetical protein
VLQFVACLPSDERGWSSLCNGHGRERVASAAVALLLFQSRLSVVIVPPAAASYECRLLLLLPVRGLWRVPHLRARRPLHFGRLERRRAEEATAQQNQILLLKTGTENEEKRLTIHA